MNIVNDKLEQYLLLAKGLRGLGLSDLIKKIIEEPGIFTFGELLLLPQVQQLRTDHSASFSLLQLFAYGTLSDYHSSPSKYGPLLETQLRKLQILTVATMAVSRRMLPYADLQNELRIDSVRQLEDLLITDCIYGGVVRGRLDQRGRCLHIEDSITRDILPEQLGDVISSLSSWLEGARAVLSGIDAQVSTVVTSTAAVEKQRVEIDAAVAAARTEALLMLDSKAMQEGTAMALDEGELAMVDVFGEENDGRPAAPRLTKRRR